jgi:hypothetical protein
LGWKDPAPDEGLGGGSAAVVGSPSLPAPAPSVQEELTKEEASNNGGLFAPRDSCFLAARDKLPTAASKSSAVHGGGESRRRFKGTLDARFFSIERRQRGPTEVRDGTKRARGEGRTSAPRLCMGPAASDRVPGPKEASDRGELGFVKLGIGRNQRGAPEKYVRVPPGAIPPQCRVHSILLRARDDS